MWIPLPMKYVSERDDYTQPAKESEAWSWLWTQRILLRREPSQREISKALCWSRHKVRQLQKDVDQFADQYFKKARTKVVPIGHGYMEDVEQTPTNKQPENNQVPTTSVPETDHPPSDPPSQTEKQQPLYSTSKSKSTCKSNLLNVGVGKGVVQAHVTKALADVYNHWHSHKKTAKAIRKAQVKTIRSALKVHTVEECNLIIDYVFLGDNWWTENNTKIESILNSKNAGGLLEDAEEWKRKPQKMSALPPQTLLPQEKQQQQTKQKRKIIPRII